jgi:hypothetical protein
MAIAQDVDGSKAPTGHDRAPVFIVGMNGSGTTMLLDSLGRHSQLYGFPRETRLMPYVIKTVRQMGDLDDDDTFRNAWELASGLSALKLVNGGEALPLPDDWRSMPRDIAAIFDRIFSDFAGRQGKSRWCEKSPQHVQHLALLHQVFPSAKFIHVVRDGRANAASFHRRWRRSPYLTIYRWKQVVRAGRSDGQRLPGQYLEVQYEELTRDPEAWMRRICEFLGLQFEPAVLESRMPQSTERGTKGKITVRKASWDGYFGNRAIAALEEIAGAELEALGYETRFKQGDADPTPLRRKFWKIKDSVWVFVLLVIEKLKGSPRPWSTLWTQPIESIRQAKSNDF